MNARTGAAGTRPETVREVPVPDAPSPSASTVHSPPPAVLPGQARTSPGGVHPQPGAAFEADAPEATALEADVPRVVAAPGPTARPGEPAHAANAEAAGNLLRCWVRENDVPQPAQDILRIVLEATGVVLRVRVHHWSPTGRHHFGPPLLDDAPAEAAPLDAVSLAALMGREAAHRTRTAGSRPTGAELAEAAGLVARVADSVQRTAEFLTRRGAEPEDPPGTGPFLAGEQALVLGHPLHPTPNSRQGLTDAESAAYSPELHAAFPLHWMAVDTSVLARDSAWTERGRTVPGEQLALRLAGEEMTSRLPPGTVPLPLHPWQARQLPHRPDIARLLEQGLLHDLGKAGERWHPTSSVRTVARPGGPAMLKLSLDLPITNSRRNNLRKELLRGLEVHRLLRAGLGVKWRAAHPGFDIVRDPAWLGVDSPDDGLPVPGLDTVVRHNPFGPADDAVCVAGLTAPRPWPGAGGALRSRLADIVARLSAWTNRPAEAVAAEWFLRYLDAVVTPVLWLDAHAGIALEAHQQNTLVLLDGAGWPAGGRYRDNQGYYFRESRRDELRQRLPGAELGAASDSFVPDAVTDERFAYYLGINNVLGLIGAFGEQRLADERLLLAGLRRYLRRQAKRDGGEPVSPLPSLLLDSPTLRCKANLLTRLHGMDELVGPVDTQSVYVTITNPLVH